MRNSSTMKMKIFFRNGNILLLKRGASKYFYYPNGKPRREYEKRVWDSERDSAGVAHVLVGKQEEVKRWRETEEYWQERFGISYTERIRENERTEQQARRKRLGIRD